MAVESQKEILQNYYYTNCYFQYIIYLSYVIIITFEENF